MGWFSETRRESGQLIDVAVCDKVTPQCDTLSSLPGKGQHSVYETGERVRQSRFTEISVTCVRGEPQVYSYLPVVTLKLRRGILEKDYFSLSFEVCVNQPHRIFKPVKEQIKNDDIHLPFKGSPLRFESFLGWVGAVVCDSRDVWLSKSSVFLTSLWNVCTQEP